jgi:predicted Zn-dependent protease
MIIVGNFEFIFYKKNIKLLKPLKKYKTLIKNEEKTTKVFEQVVVKNITHMNL